VTDKPTEAIALPVPVRQALSRIYARQAAMNIATEGLRWITGSIQDGPDPWLARHPSNGNTPARALVDLLNLPAIVDAQLGLVEDMDFVAEQLNNIFTA
jgi:hypothetical protein